MKNMIDYFNEPERQERIKYLSEMQKELGELDREIDQFNYRVPTLITKISKGMTNSNRKFSNTGGTGLTISKKFLGYVQSKYDHTKPLQKVTSSKYGTPSMKELFTTEACKSLAKQADNKKDLIPKLKKILDKYNLKPPEIEKYEIKEIDVEKTFKHLNLSEQLKQKWKINITSSFHIKLSNLDSYSYFNVNFSKGNSQEHLMSSYIMFEPYYEEVKQMLENVLIEYKKTQSEWIKFNKKLHNDLYEYIALENLRDL